MICWCESKTSNKNLNFVQICIAEKRHLSYTLARENIRTEFGNEKLQLRRKDTKAEQERNHAEQAALERGDSEAFSITAGIRAYEKAVKEYTLKHIGKVDLNECQPSDLLTFIEDINKNVSVPHFTGTDTNKETLRLVNDGIQKVAAYLQNKKASGYGVEEIKALKTIVKIAGQIHENSGGNKKTSNS